MDKVYIMKYNQKNQFHSKMYETLYKYLMTPRMIEIRKANMLKRIEIFNNQKIELLNVDRENYETEFIEYMKELEKENMQYCEKII